MNYQEIITPEMQEIWFDSTDQDINFFYIVELKNKKIGMVNLKNIDSF
jgi:hypothetical protein